MFSVCPHLGGGGVSQPTQPGGGVSPAGGGSVQLGGSGQSAGGVRSVSWGQVSQLGGQSAGGVSQPGGVSRGGGSANIGQQNQYSLHGGQYASCVHAGGLSCYLGQMLNVASENFNINITNTFSKVTSEGRCDGSIRMIHEKYKVDSLLKLFYHITLKCTFASDIGALIHKILSSYLKNCN